ncbi:hypothetical protein Pcinc_034238 [Petrolisthes cinctipes]|uniref:Uncharacterized protein n=1 Tax=Petrolisthes cinctipes TaxID=88211 RepID=A0AAE1EQM4_PETCI|nr:hypothetical protein Pcinc_034238 [Petrolisthes cinctipes]
MSKIAPQRCKGNTFGVSSLGVEYTSWVSSRHLKGVKQAHQGCQAGTSRVSSRHLKGVKQAHQRCQAGTSRMSSRHLKSFKMTVGSLVHTLRVSS